MLCFVLASLAELQSVMESLGDKVSKEEAEAMIKQADVDGDGNVDYNGTVYKFEKKKSVFCQKKK